MLLVVKVLVIREESKLTFQSEPKIRLNSSGVVRDGERASWLLDLLNMPNLDIEIFQKCIFSIFSVEI